MRRHRSLRLLTGLTSVELVCQPDGRRAAHVRAIDRGGHERRVAARHFVVAAGGLESTRLLLNSDAFHPGGLGNHSGHLGRWYMAHVDGEIADVCFEGEPRSVPIEHQRDADGVYVRRRLTVSPDAQRRSGIPNIAAWPVNPALADARHGSAVLSFAYLALTSSIGGRLAPEAIRRAMTRGTASSRRAHLRNVVASPVSAAAFAGGFGYRRFLARGRRAPGFFVRTADNRYPLHYHAEHLPNRESRVSLSNARDRAGARRLVVDIRFGDRDAAGVLAAHELWDRALRVQGIGWLEYHPGDRAASVAAQTEGGYHQIGTTRMSARPEDGVLDRHLAVHGTPNVSVVSSSAFPTSSQANSTLLIVALALRRADSLRAELRR